MLLSHAIQEYTNAGRLARASSHTINARARFGGYLVAFTSDIELDQLNPELLAQYLAHQQQRGIADHTYYSYFKHLRAFLQWCIAEELIEKNPLRKFPRPIVGETARPVLNESQIHELYQVLARDKTKFGYRNLTITALLLGTGIRSGECAALHVSDVDTATGYLLVRLGKGKKARPVPISDTLHKFLWRYLSDYRAQMLPPRNSVRYDRVGDYLFLNDDHAPLAVTGLQTLMRRILAQINVRAATHIFRHTFANEYVRADGSLEKLRRILGHVSLETTQQYVHLLPADLLAHRTDVDPLDAPLFYFRK